MSKRSYLDLTPTELLARQHVVWGLGLFAIPALLTSCHTGHYLCVAHWDGSVSPLISLWALFPWTLPIALAMAGGLGMAGLGVILLISGKYVPGADPLQTAAFRTCVGSLLAILVIGGFGYFICNAIHPGFLYAPNAGVKNAWLLPQALLLVVYLTGAALTLSATRRLLGTARAAA